LVEHKKSSLGITATFRGNSLRVDWVNFECVVTILSHNIIFCALVYWSIDDDTLMMRKWM